MFPRALHGLEQQAARLFELSRFFYRRQFGFDFFMFVVERLALADLFQAMLQWLNQQVVLGFRVGLHDGFEGRRQQFDFSGGTNAGGGFFEVIEKIVEHSMFRQQDIGNFHRLVV